MNYDALERAAANMSQAIDEKQEREITQAENLKTLVDIQKSLADMQLKSAESDKRRTVREKWTLILVAVTLAATVLSSLPSLWSLLQSLFCSHP